MNTKVFNKLLKKYKEDTTRDNKILVGFMKLDNGEYATVTMKKFETFDTPHMHIDADDVHIAVRMDKPKYYIHGEYDGKLHDNEIDGLIGMLKDRYKDANISNWEYAYSVYNHEFESDRMAMYMPEYDTLNNKV